MSNKIFILTIVLVLIRPSWGGSNRSDIKNFNYLLKRKLYHSSIYFLSRLKKTKIKIKNMEKISYFLRKKTSDFKNYKRCPKKANSSLLKTQCLINKSRRLYEKENYQRGISLMEELPPTNAFWPYLLKEKAWFYYKLKNYNKVLGLLVTYKSPLLDDYYSPEVTYLIVLTYFRMCRYKDSFLKTKEFLASYDFNINKINKKIKSLKKRRNKSLKILMGLRDFKSKEMFKRYIKKNKEITEELALIRRLTRFNKSKGLKTFLLREIRKNKNKALMYALKKMKKKKKDYIFFKRNILSLNSEIIKKRRNLLYKNKYKKNEKKMGDVKNIKRKKNAHFYSFKGAFWADELGHYHFALKNKCGKIKKGNRL